MDDIKKIASLIREISGLALSAQRTIWSLELALREAGVLSREEIASARASLDEHLREVSERLEGQENAERLISMLERFEGPVQ
jgi:hypothetical protein